MLVDLSHAVGDYFYNVFFMKLNWFVLIGLWPFIGAVFMFWVLGEFVSTNTSDAVVIWVGLGGLAIGLIPLVIYWLLGSPYFKQRPTLGSTLPDDAI